jgi:hypothetical protein
MRQFQDNVIFSFCSTCSNRLEQFRQTFDANLKIILQHPESEWIILNLNSKDSLHDFMMKKLPFLPNRVIYARETGDRPWHMSIAKNMAHRLGSGKILISLDCDNFISNTLNLLLDPIARGCQAIHLGSQIHGDGTCGRIAIERQLFYSLGGYDESFYPVGYEDLDLLARARHSGASVEICPCAPNSAIINTLDESIRYCKLEKGMSWWDCAQGNMAKSEANILSRQLTVNRGKKWGRSEHDLDIYAGHQEGANRISNMFSILICCYGNYPQYSLRSVQSILTNCCNRNLFKIYVGCNECADSTTTPLRKLFDEGKIDFLIESKRNLNKSPMMRMLIDACDTPYMLWLDDDSHLLPGWDDPIQKFILEKGPFDVAGHVFYINNPSLEYLNFLRLRPWYKSIKLETEQIWFATGGLFLARLEFLRKYNFPDRVMAKNMDDVLLGELCQQRGGRLVDFGGNREIMDRIRISDGHRRGSFTNYSKQEDLK